MFSRYEGFYAFHILYMNCSNIYYFIGSYFCKQNSEYLFSEKNMAPKGLYHAISVVTNSKSVTLQIGPVWII